MPQQSIQHKQENLSRNAFEQIAPENWEIRDVNPDLGVDFIVEIFASDGASTGAFFFVQLKSTASVNHKTQRELRISKKHHEYYGELQLPTLIVRHSSAMDCLWARWHHSFDPGSLDITNEKSVCFKFSDSDKLTDDTFQRLTKEAFQIQAIHSRTLKYPVYISIQFGDLSTLAKINSTLLFNEIDDWLDCNKEIIKICKPSDPRAIGKLCIDNNVFRAEIATLGSISFHFAEIDLQNITQISVVAIGIAFIQAGCLQVGLPILKNYMISEKPINIEPLIECIAYLLRKPTLVVDIHRWGNELGGINAKFIGIQTFAHFLAWQSGMLTNIENDWLFEFIINEAKKYELEDKQLAAIIWYQLARVAQFDRNYIKAKELIEKAINYYPDLLKFHFICGDYATALYETGNLKKAYKHFKLFDIYHFPHFSISFVECLASMGKWQEACKTLSVLVNRLDQKINHVRLELLIKVSDWICSQHLKNPSYIAKSKSSKNWLDTAYKAAEKMNWNVAFHSALAAAIMNKKNADAWECAIVYARQLLQDKGSTIIQGIIALAYQYVGNELIESAKRFASMLVGKHLLKSEDEIPFVEGQVTYIEHLPRFFKRNDVILLSKTYRRMAILVVLSEGYTFMNLKNVK